MQGNLPKRNVVLVDSMPFLNLYFVRTSSSLSSHKLLQVPDCVVKFTLDLNFSACENSKQKAVMLEAPLARIRYFIFQYGELSTCRINVAKYLPIRSLRTTSIMVFNVISRNLNSSNSQTVKAFNSVCEVFVNDGTAPNTRSNSQTWDYPWRSSETWDPRLSQGCYSAYSIS